MVWTKLFDRDFMGRVFYVYRKGLHFKNNLHGVLMIIIFLSKINVMVLCGAFYRSKNKKQKKGFGCLCLIKKGKHFYIKSFLFFDEYWLTRTGIIRFLLTQRFALVRSSAFRCIRWRAASITITNITGNIRSPVFIRLKACS